MGTHKYIRWFSEVNRNDIPLVGGKGANLGELTQNGVAVPPGFCVIAGAYRDFIRISGLNASIENIIRNIDFENTDDLSDKCGEIRKLIMEAPFPKEIEKEVKEAYVQLAQKTGLENVQVAVRSSATAEDLPDASFAGQQDTYLHIRGAEEVLKHVQRCWASLWTARATYYREKQDFNHFEVALSAVVQKMVRSEKSGVLFTANPVSNDLNQIMINASWGLGEAVVSGVVTPDEFILEKDHLDVVEKTISEKNTMIVEKDGDIGTVKVAVKDFLGPDKVKMQCLTDMEIITLGKAGKTIESLYNAPQDIEWALDQDTKELYILQARPITTLAKGESSVDQNTTPKETKLNVLARGLAASPGTAVGKVIVIEDINEIARVKDGDILVTGMTNPDMVPAMRKAAAVVTDEGGRTCHAAIVSRELGIPCIVGSKNGTAVLAEGMLVTVDATRGVVFEGNVVPEKKEAEKATLVSPGAQALPIEELVHQLAPITGTKIYMNLGEPSIIDRYKNLPFDGIGLMRTEFIFTNMVGIHPMYLVKTGQGKLLVDKMSEGITTVAQAIYPRPVVVRMSDFRTNEFRGLKGGEEVEPVENNPMIGWRGVSRYISSEYEAGFRLECAKSEKSTAS